MEGNTLKIDLFASQLSHQLPQYIAWKSNPFSLGKDAFQQIWTKTSSLFISPILPYSSSVMKSRKGLDGKNVACHTNLAIANWYPLLM